MEYKKFNDQYVLRLDPEDKIIESLKKFALKEHIVLATVEGIGAVKSFTVGFFNPVTKQYQEKQFDGYFEITSLLGNITTKNNEPYFHLHGTFGNDQYLLFGGHLKEATVSITGEIFVKPVAGAVNREMNPIGINIIKF
jgi:predicted DNA-binding protein with PD1-like motif